MERQHPIRLFGGEGSCVYLTSAVAFLAALTAILIAAFVVVVAVLFAFVASAASLPPAAPRSAAHQRRL